MLHLDLIKFDLSQSYFKNSTKFKRKYASRLGEFHFVLECEVRPSAHIVQAKLEVRVCEMESKNGHASM